jgi:protein AroM
MKIKLGVALIGQGPRPDYEAFFRQCLNADDEIIVKGALDELTFDEIKALKRQKGDGVLATVDRNFVPIVIPEAEVKKRMPEKISLLEKQGANIIVVVCTGQFVELSSKVPLVLPSEVLTHTVSAIARGCRIGVLVPEKEQIPQLQTKWITVDVDAYMAAVSPFNQSDMIAQACIDLKRYDPSVIVMDCMGYDQRMRETARLASGKPVISARSILAKYICELVGK